MIDYRIDTFLLLCDLMNYRKTADALGITQPAVTQQIHYLERSYGIKLFEYQNSRLRKTDAAVLLEKHARTMRLQDQLLRQKFSSQVRSLRVGATKTIGDYVLKDEIEQFLRQDCTELTLIVDNTERLLKLLDQNELDFAVVEGYFDHRLYDNQLLRKEPFVGICPVNHPFAGQNIPISELFQETIIHREAGSGTRAILEEKLLGYNESLDRFKHQICISSFPVILDLVKKGIGVSFVYEVLANSDPNIAKFAIKNEPIVREFNVVYLKNADLHEQIEWFFGRSLET
ncbi:MAG: LysR family transcriptional regulator [Oscillospiraceae bacterium]|nr:LysR family transcriptional regulator [Oscillospiraceae bacterium]